MKNLLYFLLALILFSCNKKNEPLKPDSIYNLASEWEKQDGSKITFSDFQGKVIVTTMIFSSCKTACPKLTDEMRNISKKVGNVDPEEPAP